MADLTQVAPSIEICVTRPDLKNASAEIPGFGDSQCSARLPKHDEHQSLFDGIVLDTEVDRNIEENQTQGSPCGADDHGELTSTQFEVKQECDIGSMMKQDGTGVENALSQKSSERAGVEGQAKICETPYDGDVEACSSQLSKLSVFPREEKTCEEGLYPAKKGTQTKTAQAASEQSEDEHRQEHAIATAPARKQAGWSTPEEPEFVMEDSSWPTLAEAQHAKSIRSRSTQARTLQPRSSVSDKEVALMSLPVQRVPSSQANLQERPVETLKHTNAHTSAPGSKYKAPYKKGGYGKPSFSATENLPLPPMGVHVPSANMFIPDHSVKGNGLVGINKFFPGPHQAPAHGPFYYHRAENLAPFPNNSAVPPTYARGHTGWQHYGRGYGDSNYKHTGFIPPYDQQHLNPRHSCPPVTPFMNMNVAHYNYSSYQGDVAYVPGAPSPGFNYATPYFRPPGPPGVMVQAPADIPTLKDMLQKQIEYYFSVENLCHDTFLTSKMDDEGFVPLSLIASFPRVRSLTWNTMLILDAMKNSTLVEVKNGKLRSHEWRRWKPISSANPGMQGSPSRRNNHTGSEIVRDQESGELEASQKSHLDNMRSLSETRMVAGSCSAPWTGMAANVGAVNVPMVTSIDSR